MKIPRKFPWKTTIAGVEFSVYRTSVQKNGKNYKTFSVAYYLHGKREATRRSAWDEVWELIDEVVRAVRAKATESLELTGHDRRSYLAAVEVLLGEATVGQAARDYQSAQKVLKPHGLGVVEGGRAFGRPAKAFREDLPPRGC